MPRVAAPKRMPVPKDGDILPAHKAPLGVT